MHSWAVNTRVAQKQERGCHLLGQGTPQQDAALLGTGQCLPADSASPELIPCSVSSGLGGFLCALAEHRVAGSKRWSSTGEW